jgi:ADP-heptose:LPS heptosyltransferase
VAEINSVLVIRRDNIGDLVCTTPLLTALRKHYPNAWIGALVNSYNAPVLDRNPDIDEVFSYQKLKHLEGGSTAIGALTRRAVTLWSLRRKKIDLVVVAAGIQDTRGANLARWLSPRRIVQPLTVRPGQHEVEHVFTAARGLGIDGPIPPLRVVPAYEAIDAVREALHRAGMDGFHPLIAVHISARRPSQRWPTVHFAELIIALERRLGAATMLLWSPGLESHSQHPGDDRKATEIITRIEGNAKVLPYATKFLPDLIGALAICDALVCSDGGAMHLAAGLQKPIACFFGDSPVERWRPWGVPQVVLQAASHQAKDISIEEVVHATANLVQARSASG